MPALEQILQQEETFVAPAALKAQANLQDFDAEYRRSIDDNEGFWAAWAERFVWTKPWEKVLDWQFPDHRWFVGGETNITLNALDRPADGSNRTRVALPWLGED